MNTSLQRIGTDEWSVLRDQATMLVGSGFLPPSIKTPENAIAIILMGRELNIGPMAALQTINIIQNKPTVSPQLMLALIRRSDQLEKFSIKTGADGAVCMMKRKGDDPHTATFGPKEAKALGLDGKDNYKKQAATMYQWRAVAAAARAVFPDVILGLYTPDEMGGDVDVETGESLQVEPAQIAETVEPPRDADVQAEITEVCKLLNLAGDDIKWGGRTLKEYIAEQFNGAEDLTPAMWKGLLVKLKLRLDALNSVTA